MKVAGYTHGRCPCHFCHLFWLAFVFVHDISASAPLHYSRRLDWPVFRIQLSESLRLPWYVLVRVDDLLLDAITWRNLLTRNLHLRPYVPKALQRFWLSPDSGSICMHLGASDKGCALGREHHPIHWNMHSRFRSPLSVQSMPCSCCYCFVPPSMYCSPRNAHIVTSFGSHSPLATNATIQSVNDWLTCFSRQPSFRRTPQPRSMCCYSATLKDLRTEAASEAAFSLSRQLPIQIAVFPDRTPIDGVMFNRA